MEKIEEQFKEELLKYRKDINIHLKNIQKLKQKINEEVYELEILSNESGIPFQYEIENTRCQHIPKNFFEQMSKIKNLDNQFEIFGDFCEYDRQPSSSGWLVSQIC
jgi:hypothetical protein